MGGKAAKSQEKDGLPTHTSWSHDQPGTPGSGAILASSLGLCLLISRMRRLLKIKAFPEFHFKAGKLFYS